MIKLPKIITLSILPLLISPHLKSQDNKVKRPLIELNSPFESEAYPHLSSDGMRLYYTVSSGEKSNLYVASRKKLGDLFIDKTILSNDFPNGSFSCWLTEDELKVYFVQENSIYFSERKDLKSIFSSPVKLKIKEEIGGFISSPSLTPDGKELFIYNVNKQGKSNILIFKEEEGAYNYNSSLTIPDNYIVQSGQLSHDGLAYYLSARLNGTDKVYLMEREKLGRSFNNFRLIPGEINIDPSSIQPAPGDKESSAFVFVKNIDHNWKNNDLYLIEDVSKMNAPQNEETTLTVDEESLDKKENEIFSLYPVPATDELWIKLGEDVDANDITGFTIYSYNGIENKKIPHINTSNLIRVNCSDLPSGIYFCSISYQNQKSSIKFQIIK